MGEEKKEKSNDGTGAVITRDEGRTGKTLIDFFMMNESQRCELTIDEVQLSGSTRRAHSSPSNRTQALASALPHPSMRSCLLVCVARVRVHWQAHQHATAQ